MGERPPPKGEADTAHPAHRLRNPMRASAPRDLRPAACRLPLAACCLPKPARAGYPGGYVEGGHLWGYVEDRELRP